MSDSILAWHFSDGELRFDYAGVKIEAGLVLEKDETPLSDKSGFHGSRSALDALCWYAIQPQDKYIVSRVRLSGEIVEKKANTFGAQRLLAQKREHLWVADAKAVLEAFVELQKIALEENHKLAMSLIPSRWFWDNDASPEMVSSKQEKQRKATEKILLHPLGNQVLEFANLVSRLEKEIRTLRIWEKAQEDAFDMDAYLAENRNRYLGVRPMSLLDWVFQNPPEKYKGLVPIPKEPHEVFHKMLMKFAPEGYGE